MDFQMGYWKISLHFLFPEKNVEKLYDKMLYLLEHPELWGTMGKLGSDFVKNNYDLKITGKILEDIYYSYM